MVAHAAIVALRGGIQEHRGHDQARRHGSADHERAGAHDVHKGVFGKARTAAVARRRSLVDLHALGTTLACAHLPFVHGCARGIVALGRLPAELLLERAAGLGLGARLGLGATAIGCRDPTLFRLLGALIALLRGNARGATLLGNGFVAFTGGAGGAATLLRGMPGGFLFGIRLRERVLGKIGQQRRALATRGLRGTLTSTGTTRLRALRPIAMLMFWVTGTASLDVVEREDMSLP